MAILKTFRVGERQFTHVLLTSDDSIELRDEDDETVLIYNRHAQVFDRDGKVGDIHMETVSGVRQWVYYENPLRTRIVYGSDLLQAEVEVSRRYIEGKSAN